MRLAKRAAATKERGPGARPILETRKNPPDGDIALRHPLKARRCKQGCPAPRRADRASPDRKAYWGSKKTSDILLIKMAAHMIQNDLVRMATENKLVSKTTRQSPFEAAFLQKRRCIVKRNVTELKIVTNQEKPYTRCIMFIDQLPIFITGLPSKKRILGYQTDPDRLLKGDTRAKHPLCITAFQQPANPRSGSGSCSGSPRS